MKHFIILSALLLAAAQTYALPIRSTGCAPTAEAAIAHLLQGTHALDTTGFRVDAVHHDNLRDRSWAMVVSCTEPSRPRVAVLLPQSVALQSSVQSTPIIRAGERVKVLSRTGDSQMELLGWAEEAGAEKQQIRVRLGLAVDADHKPLSLRCAVLSAGIVEVVR